MNAPGKSAKLEQPDQGRNCSRINLPILDKQQHQIVHFKDYSLKSLRVLFTRAFTAITDTDFEFSVNVLVSNSSVMSRRASEFTGPGPEVIKLS